MALVKRKRGRPRNAPMRPYYGQHIGVWLRDNHHSEVGNAERALAVAVICYAMQDQDEAWLYTADFEFYCDLLGFNYEYQRERYYKYYHGRSAVEIRKWLEDTTYFKDPADGETDGNVTRLLRYGAGEE